jgi:hypothetical protein
LAFASLTSSVIPPLLEAPPGSDVPIGVRIEVIAEPIDGRAVVIVRLIMVICAPLGDVAVIASVGWDVAVIACLCRRRRGSNAQRQHGGPT